VTVIALWLLLVVVGFAVAILASRQATHYAQFLALRAGVPPLVIGLTLIGIGTNLPEIANSVAASISRHGDLNAGTAVGSVAVDLTLVLGLLPWIAGAFYLGRIDLRAVAGAIVFALLMGLLLVLDGHLSRLDGALLVLTWGGGTAVIWTSGSTLLRAEVEEPSEGPILTQLLATLGALLLVAAGATVAVIGLVNVAEDAGVPEYAISFFGASIGTSLPELVVNATAVRHRAWGLAIGDALGSAFVDATISLGIGPLIAPTAIDTELAVRGAIGALLATLLVLAIFWNRVRLDRPTGALFLLAYLALFPLVLAGP
jgi:cation:H+ antiporter